jgi:hypothetical protein
MSVTLLQLRTRSRQRADQETSNFIEDDELNGYINASIAELYDLMVAAYGSDYFLADYSFSIVSGTQNYTLPADFYKLKGIDVNLSNNNWFSIRPFNFNERNRNDNITWGVLSGPSIRYRIMGNNVKLSPNPDSNYSARVWYVPKATVLVADTDVFDDMNQWAEYVITDAAIKMMQKEESDTGTLEKQKAELKRRIEIMADNRDAGQPESVSDIYAENDEYWFSRSSS